MGGGRVGRGEVEGGVKESRRSRGGEGGFYVYR